MAATAILVQVVTVDVLDEANFSEWSFKANVRRLPSGTTKAFGKPGDVWEANQGDTLDLSGWDAAVVIQPSDRKVEVNLKGSEKKGLFVRHRRQPHSGRAPPRSQPVHAARQAEAARSRRRLQRSRRLIEGSQSRPAS